MAGTVMLLAGALAAMQLTRPQWVEQIPASTQTRGVAVAIVVVLGAALQWMFSPRAKAAAKESEKPKSPPGAEKTSAPIAPRPAAKPTIVPMKLKEARA
jgi:hypothetical protein